MGWQFTRTHYHSTRTVSSASTGATRLTREEQVEDTESQSASAGLSWVDSRTTL